MLWMEGIEIEKWIASGCPDRKSYENMKGSMSMSDNTSRFKEMSVEELIEVLGSQSRGTK